MHTENLTILFVDIADFTATTNRQSRRQNAHLLKTFETLVKPQIKQFSGSIVKSIGDALLLTFHSPTDAMLCAQRMHDRLVWFAEQNPQHEAIVIRTAAHLGEVRLYRNDVFGEAVNLAARIETVTPAGEIYLSAAVYLAMNKTEVQVEPALQFTPDGFSHEIQLYKVRKAADSLLPYGSQPADFASRRFTIGWQAFLALGLLIAATLLAAWYHRAPPVSVAKTLQVPNQKPRYIEVALTPTDAAILSPAIQAALQTELQRAVRQSKGFYQADAYTVKQASDKIEVQIKAGIWPKPPLVNIRFQRQNMALQLEWPAEHSERLLAEATRFVQSVLTQQPAVTTVYQPKLPASVFLQYLKARQLITQAQQTQATDAYWQALQLLNSESPQILLYPPALSSLCLVALELSAAHAAASQLQSSLAHCASLKNATDAESLLAYGRYLSRNNQLADAEASLTAAIAEDPKAAEAYSALASVYQQKGELLEAERIYNLAVQQQPHHWFPLHALAVFQLERGRYDEAARLFGQVVRLLPDNASALTNLGSVYLLQGQLQAAAETYQNALQLQATADTQSNLATVYYYLGRLTDAVRLYQQALQQQPERYELHGNLADALRHAGDLDAAQRSYQQAFRLVEQQPKLDARALALKAHYADFLHQQQATDWMATARGMDSTNAEVWLLSAQLAARRQDIAQATSAIEQAVQFGFPVKLLSSDPDLAPLVNDKNLQKSLQNGRNSL